MVNFYNPYMTQGNYMTELQNMRDRIDNQIQQVQQQQQNMAQMPMQQPSINQTFQLSPNNQSGLNYIENEDALNKEIVIMDTLFVNKEFTNLWLKKSNGDIKKYKLEEIVPIDEKDIKIQQLEKQIQGLMNLQNNSKNKEQSISENSLSIKQNNPKNNK